MSSYLVSEATTATLAEMLYKAINRGEVNTHPVSTAPMPELASMMGCTIAHLDMYQHGDPIYIYRALRQLNYDALEARYSDPHYDASKDHMPAQHSKVIDTIPLYKLLEGYLYQCAEGDVPKRPLYQMLEALQDRIGRRIVMSLPAYLAAGNMD